MLTIKLAIVALEVMWHIPLCIVHLWPRAVPEKTRDPLIGICYVGITVTLIVAAFFLLH